MRWTMRMKMQAMELLERGSLLSTYYGSPGGNNGAAGTAAAPWLTLQFAADHVVAGDVVMVAAGQYTGFDIRHGGTSTSTITFKGQSGAIINKVNTKTGRDGINIENASYIVIDGFKLVG